MQLIRVSVVINIGLGVSIPQAVGTVATDLFIPGMQLRDERFNTASGRYCCNNATNLEVGKTSDGYVSIPQAVGTVAT